MLSTLSAYRATAQEPAALSNKERYERELCHLATHGGTFNELKAYPGFKCFVHSNFSNPLTETVMETWKNLSPLVRATYLFLSESVTDKKITIQWASKSPTELRASIAKTERDITRCLTQTMQTLRSKSEV